MDFGWLALEFAKLELFQEYEDNDVPAFWLLPSELKPKSTIPRILVQLQAKSLNVIRARILRVPICLEPYGELLQRFEVYR